MAARQTKTQLRALLRARRARLTADQQALAAKRLAANLTAARPFLSSRRIACYIANDSEIGTHEIMWRIWGMNKICYLPVLSRLSGDSLWFGRMEPDTPLVMNRFGIPEPRLLARELVRAQKLDLILLPLVGFDPEGNRLGMGGGFYDRSLAFRRNRNHWKKPHLLGLAHDIQRVDKLHSDPCDVRIDGIVTDAAIYLSP